MKFRWKSPTQITKVADTNHLDMSRCLRQSPWQVRDKPVCVALMEFSPLQCTGKVGDKVVDKVRGLCRKVGVMEFGLCWAVYGPVEKPSVSKIIRNNHAFHIHTSIQATLIQLSTTQSNKTAIKPKKM